VKIGLANDEGDVIDDEVPDGPHHHPVIDDILDMPYTVPGSSRRHLAV